MRLWNWRMRGGAYEEVLTRFSAITARAAAGDLDHWADTPMGRRALIIIFDQFTRSVWAGTPRAYAYDERGRDLCLEGLKNGHFDALENVWQETAFKIPLEHCECMDPADHLANLDIAISIADCLIDEAPQHLRQVSQVGAQQPQRHRAECPFRPSPPPRRVSRPALLAFAGKQFVELLQLLRQCGRRAL